MILVTGASGFVGRHVTRALSADGPPVRAMVRDARGAATLEGVRCELVRGDVTDPASLRAASRGVRAIVHLVAIVEGSPATFERVMAAHQKATASRDPHECPDCTPEQPCERAKALEGQ